MFTNTIATPKTDLFYRVNKCNQIQLFPRLTSESIGDRGLDSRIKIQCLKICSRTSTLPHSRTPALPHSRTPALPHSRTPALPHSRTPALPQSSYYLMYRRNKSATHEYTSF